MKTLQHRRARLSRESTLVMLVLLALSALFFSTGILHRWDILIYDALLRLWPRPALEDIVVVAIDDHSLKELGRWPWSRQVHAQFLKHLTASPKVTALDLIFAEPDRDDPKADIVLAEAIAANGRVVLPVVPEQHTT